MPDNPLAEFFLESILPKEWTEAIDSPTLNRSAPAAQLRGFTRGVVESSTSPLDLLLMGLGGGAGVAAKGANTARRMAKLRRAAYAAEKRDVDTVIRSLKQRTRDIPDADTDWFYRD